MRKTSFKRQQESINPVQKELTILKFPELMYLQNFLFMSQIETNQTCSFVDLRHCVDNHNYLIKSKAKSLLDLFLASTQIYATTSETISHIYICKNVPIN